jgi:hypothetical protein
LVGAIWIWSHYLELDSSIYDGVSDSNFGRTLSTRKDSDFEFCVSGLPSTTAVMSFVVLGEFGEMST